MHAAGLVSHHQRGFWWLLVGTPTTASPGSLPLAWCAAVSLPNCPHHQLWLCERSVFRIRIRLLPFPFGNDGGSQAITYQVDRGTRHVHQLVDTKDEENRFDRQSESRCCTHEDH